MKRKKHRVLAATLLIMTAAILLCLVPLVSSAAADEKTKVATAEELMAALGDSSVSSILFKENISTSSNISLSKPVDLGGKTWSVSSGTVLVNAEIGNGTFQYEGAGEIRYPKEILLCGADAGETVTSITAGGKTDSNETYVKGKAVTVSGGKGSAGIYVLADNVAGSIAVARTVSSCKTSGGEYVVKGFEGSLYKVYRIKYVIRFTDKDGNKIDNPGISVKNSNVTEYTSYDGVALQNLEKIEEGMASFEFSGWYDENSNPVSGVAIPAGSTGDKTFYGIYVGGGFKRGGRGGFNFGSMISEMQEEEKKEDNSKTEAEEGLPAMNQKRVSKASSKTTTTFSNVEQNKVDLSQITETAATRTSNPSVGLVIGIAVMVIAVAGGILVLTKKR